VATIIDSLLIRLGFQTDPKQLEGFAKNVKQIKKEMEGVSNFAKAYLGFEGLKRAGVFVKSAIESMAGIQDFSELVDMSATDVAALGRVAEESGASLAGMEGTIASMNAVLGQAASGFPRAEMMLSRFGLKAKDAHGKIKTFDQILGEVADKMEGASTGKRLAMANALGIDPKLIPLLKEGSENFQRLREEALKAGSFKNSDFERAHESEKLLNKAEGAFQRLKQRLILELLPTIGDLLRKFTAWVSDSKNIAKIQGYINDVVKVAKLLLENAGKIAAVFAVIYAHKYGKMFVDWGVSVSKLAKSCRSAGGASAALTAGFGVMRATLTGGLLGLFALLIEDLLKFEKGGRSVTGWMVNKFPAGAEVMKLAIAGIGAAASVLITGSGPLGLIIIGMAAWVIAIKAIKKNWGLLIDEIVRGLKRLEASPTFSAIRKTVAPIKSMLKHVATPIEKIKKIEKFVVKHVAGVDLDETHKAKDKAEAAPGGKVRASSGPADWQAPGAAVFADFDRGQQWRMDRPAAVGEVNNRQEVTFHINGVTDPKAVAAEVERVFNRIDIPNMGKLNRDQTRNGQTGAR
jgi:hypothetical protein